MGIETKWNNLKSIIYHYALPHGADYSSIMSEIIMLEESETLRKAGCCTFCAACGGWYIQWVTIVQPPVGDLDFITLPNAFVLTRH